MQWYVNLNGKTVLQEKAAISPDNRSFRYGDGCFETLKLINGKVLLKHYHFDRLFASLKLMYFVVPLHFTASYLEKAIVQLALKNGHQHMARIRLTLSRGNGGLYDSTTNMPDYLIQTWPLSETANSLNINGLQIGIYHEAKKIADQFSPIKSNSFLCYSLGAQWAKQQRLNDCILLNPYNNIADATIANVFVVKNGIVLTPPLADGPINGVMRRHLLESMSASGIPYQEVSLTHADLLECTELFLTNAISGIKWVQQLEKKEFDHQHARTLHQRFVAPLFTM